MNAETSIIYANLTASTKNRKLRFEELDEMIQKTGASKSKTPYDSILSYDKYLETLKKK